jgi:hypothetical protein
MARLHAHKEMSKSIQKIQPPLMSLGVNLQHYVHRLPKGMAITVMTHNPSSYNPIPEAELPCVAVFFNEELSDTEINLNQLNLLIQNQSVRLTKKVDDPELRCIYAHYEAN